MSDDRTDTTKDRLPDWVAGRLGPGEADAVEAAVAADPDLADEADLLRALAAARPETPPGLSARIVRAVREDREHRAGSPRRPPRPSVEAVAGGEAGKGAEAAVRRPALRRPVVRWTAAAAAVAVLAVGTLELIDRTTPTGAAGGPLDQVALDDASSPWVAEDGFVAGAPVLDALSDEALSSLLEELEG